MSEHLSRALRPVVMEIPLKTGVNFNVALEKYADKEGELLIKVKMSSLFDFDVTLTIEDYGTLGKLIDVLNEARDVELERIKMLSARARRAKSDSYRSVSREPTTPNPGVPEKGPRRRKRRRVYNAGAR